MVRLVDINIRDHVRYTGDGLPNEPVGHPPPVGDPTSGVYNPTKADIRNAIGDVEGDRILAEAAAAAAVAASADVQGATLFAADRAALIANTATGISAGTVFATRAEGYAFEVVASGGDMVTAGGTQLRVLPSGGAYNVRAFGARGDGTADDSAAFQAAVNAAGDGVVIVPPGTYRLRDIIIPRGTLLDCRGGPIEVTGNASGTTATTVSFRYNGTGGTGSRMFTFQASTTGQWVKGGGIIGRPHLSGENLCETLIDARSVHGGRFDVEMSRATVAGMSLNGANGVLSQFCEVDFKYVYGALAATEASHGLVLNGNAPGATDWVGCTQHRVWSQGLIHDGDMVRMVGHCDNNHMWLHGTAGMGAGRGTGRTLSINQGKGGVAARLNHVHYACGRIFLQAGSFGNHFDFVSSEGASITGGGQFSIGSLIDYVSGKSFTSEKAPLSERRFISAAQMLPTGAAVKEVAAGTGLPIIRLPKSAQGGAAFSLHDVKWGTGTVVGIEWVYRVGLAGAGTCMMEATITHSATSYGASGPAVLTDPVAVNGPIVQSQIRTTVLPLPENGVVGVHAQRLVGNSSDTMTQDLQLIGVNLMIDFNGPATMEAPVAPWQEKV